MDDLATPVFHVGFPKSGSTFLQHRVFPFLDEYSYMGVHAAEGDQERHALLNRFHISLFKTDGLNFNLDVCKKDLDAIKDINPDEPPLFSYEYGISVLFAYPDVVTRAERLKKVFGDNLKVIIIVREQNAILKSQYRDHPFEPHDIHRGKPVSFEKWYKLTDELRFFRFTDLLYYDRLVNVYDEIFGKDNVLALPLELMRHDPDLYSQKMANFLGVDQEKISQNLGDKLVNVGKSAGENRLRKLRRRLPIPIEFSKILPAPVCRGVKGFIDGGSPERVDVSEAFTEEIRQRYAVSNKRLEKRMNVPMEALGYAVESDDDNSLDTVESPFGKFTGYKGDRAIAQIRKFGAHTRPELNMVLSFIKEGDNIVDVGAHIGTFAVPMKKVAGSEGKLFAFEANPETSELLETNFRDNEIDGKIINSGVSCKSGSLFLQKRKYKYKSCISDYLVEASPDGDTNLVEVDLIKVDDVVSDPINFIKIDVEGMEVDVIKSAEKTIDKSRPVIYSEYVDFYIKRAGGNPKDFEDFFAKRDYHYFINIGARNAANDDFQLVRVPGPQYIRGQVDFLLVPKESDRYPTEYKNWFQVAPHKFLWGRFRNLLKDVNAKYKIIKR